MRNAIRDSPTDLENMLTPHDESIIRRFAETIRESFPVLTVITNADKRGDVLKRFCEAISTVEPRLRVRVLSDEAADMPFIQVLPNLRYHAAPGGKELPVFLETLRLQRGPAPQLPEDIAGKLKTVSLPAIVDIFIMSACPFCPKTVERLIPVAATNESVRVSIIDAELFPEKAGKAGIRSVPSVLLDHAITWRGATRLHEIVKRIVDRDPMKLGVETVKAMLEDGNALKVAKLMLKAGKIIPAFITLLCDPKWSVRLGAMVAMESIVSEDIRLAADAATLLWRNFDSVEDPVKGDMLYVIGQSGAKHLLPEIQTVAGGRYGTEVKEYAQEAIIALNSQPDGSVGPS
jgi:hypothetical protein